MGERQARWCLVAGWLALSMLTTGCGDLTSATGDEGLLRFSLVTDFEVPQNDLRDATLVTRHSQHIDVDLTSRGREEIENPGAIRYTLTGGTAEGSGGSSDSAPEVDVTMPTTTASARLSAMVDGEEVDGLDLQFEDIASFELSVRTREPWGEELTPVSTEGPTRVQEGTQITLLPIPLGQDGNRLAGDITTTTSVDMMDIAVPGQSVVGVYEDGVWESRGNIEFYLIDPTDLVTFTVIDTLGDAQGQHQFIVTDFQGPDN